MDIHIKENDKLTIFAIDPSGNQKTFVVSYDEMMYRGETIIDGLTETEIQELRHRRKVCAVRLLRRRTNVDLPTARTIIENWAKKHQCCKDWPYCKHMTTIDSLEIEDLKFKSNNLSILWHFRGKINITQAKALMELAGYRVKDYGCYSFVAEDGASKWASNKKLEEE